MTPYETVFKSFLRKIEDKDFPLFEETEQQELLNGWLDTAIAYIELDKLKIVNDLSARDNDLQEFEADLQNCEIEVIAMYMVVAWYEPKIHSLEHTLMFVGSKDEKWTSQKDHLEMMLKVQHQKRLEARKYFRNYGYKENSYLNEGV